MNSHALGASQETLRTTPETRLHRLLEWAPAAGAEAAGGAQSAGTAAEIIAVAATNAPAG